MLETSYFEVVMSAAIKNQNRFWDELYYNRSLIISLLCKTVELLKELPRTGDIKKQYLKDRSVVKQVS